MFQVRNPILYYFLLVLEVFLDLAPDVVHKRVRMSETFLSEGLKFLSSYSIGFLSLNIKLVLLLAKVYSSTKERGYKRYAFVAFCSNSLKIVFALLTEVVTIYIQILMIEI